MKISNNKSIFSIFCLLAAIVFGLYILALPSISVYAQQEIDCNPSAGDIQLDTGDCLRQGSLSHTLARANTSLNIVGLLVNTLITIVIALAFFYFFWNLVKYIRDEEGKDEAKTKMGYSLGAIFVIVTLWGIVSFLRNVLGVENESAAPSITIPAVGFSKIDSVERQLEIIDAVTSCTAVADCRKHIKPALDIGRAEKGRGFISDEVYNRVASGRVTTADLTAIKTALGPIRSEITDRLSP